MKTITIDALVARRMVMTPQPLPIGARMKTITIDALVARVNRRLAHSGEKMRRPRGEYARRDVGDFYIIDVDRNFVVSWPIYDLEDWVRSEMPDLLKPWETTDADRIAGALLADAERDAEGVVDGAA